MTRVKIEEPEKYLFLMECSVRVTDLNYGNHLANDKVLTYAHEARMAWLSSLKISELDFWGVSLIQGDTAIVYKSEGFYADKIEISVGLMDVSRASFNLVYKMHNLTTNKLLALVKTGMVCFDYQSRTVKNVPEQLRQLQTN